LGHKWVKWDSPQSLQGNFTLLVFLLSPSSSFLPLLPPLPTTLAVLSLLYFFDFPFCAPFLFMFWTFKTSEARVVWFADAFDCKETWIKVLVT
jgi:small-conductance mechanosensitive channel